MAGGGYGGTRESDGRETARAAYGVVLKNDSLDVDWIETERARQS